MLRRLLLGLGVTVLSLNLAGHAGAGATANGTVARGIAGLNLEASPGVVDVGGDVTFTLSARSWPGPVGTRLSFVSPHHGFSGTMSWESQCSCFRVAVHLARRVHPLETGRATATVTFKGARTVVYAGFQVRGLAGNGVDFAPGGLQTLSAWVSDPEPGPSEAEHYCAWVTTADGLGVPNLKVQFVVHYSGRNRAYQGGNTGKTGLTCVQKNVEKARAGTPIGVDVLAGSLHAHFAFTPRNR